MTPSFHHDTHAHYGINTIDKLVFCSLTGFFTTITWEAKAEYDKTRDQKNRQKK